jgi:hypothetical protein
MAIAVIAMAIGVIAMATGVIAMATGAIAMATGAIAMATGTIAMAIVGYYSRCPREEQEESPTRRAAFAMQARGGCAVTWFYILLELGYI